MIWHSHEIPEVLQELRVDPSTGLSSQETADRLKEYGKNCLHEQKSISFRQAFVNQMRSIFVILPIAVSGIVLFGNLYAQFIKNISADWLTPVLVILLTGVVAVMSAIRRCRAASAMAELRDLSAPETRVLRDGAEQVCSSHELVPGDILMLNVGDIVPADCRLIEAGNLRCDEGELTDATSPTEKYADRVFDDITPLAQRSNMLYAGSAVTCGTATAVVVATGTRSEMGHATDDNVVATLPKQKAVVRLQNWITLIAVALSIVFMIVGLAQNKNRSTMILTASVLAIAAIPQGISTLMARSTIHSIKRMAQMSFRLRRPNAIKELGEVDVLCVEQDVLTFRNDVRLQSAFVGHQTVYLDTPTMNAPGLAQLMRLAALNTHEGHPTDQAILNVLPKVNVDINELLLDMPRIGELSPTDTRKTAVHLAGDQALILVSGEWRSLLPLCVKGSLDELSAAAHAMEGEGLQVIAVSYRLDDTPPSVYTAEALEHDLTCVGLLGFRVPLHSDVAQAVNRIHHLRTILFSDEPVSVASAAALHAGITDASNVLTAEEMDTLTNDELIANASLYNVCCRFSAAQKLRLLSALQQQGAVVAITGWHSEDADLLTQANVGIARVNATDIAKEAADIVLTDDTFSTIITTIQEGRRANAERAGLWVYLLCYVAIIFILAFGTLWNWLPLHRLSLLLLSLHIIFSALPTPLWLPLGISNALHKLHEKK